MRPRLPVHQIRQSLASFNWSAAYRAIYDTVCGGATLIMVSFALALGIEKEQIGWITSAVSFACLLQMLGPTLASAVPDRKSFVLRLGYAEPLLMMAAVAALPWLPQAARIPVLAAAVFMAAASIQLTRPITEDWVATVLPAGLRGRYLGRRLQLASLFGIAAILASGFLAQAASKTNPLGLAAILVGGGVFGLMSVAVLRRATMPDAMARARFTWAGFRQVFTERPFRRLMLAVAIYNLPFFFACPYYQVYYLRILNMKESWVAWMMVGYTVIKALTSTAAGRWVDRVGARRAILVCGPLYAVFFVSFPFATPQCPWPVIIAWTLVGLGDAAWNVAYTASVYAAIPPGPSRPMFFAVASLLMVGAFGVGAILAIPLLRALEPLRLTLFGQPLTHFHILYALCAAVMLPGSLAGLLFPSQRKPKA